MISGSGGVLKTGAGAFTVVGNQTYTGPTVVADGQMNVQGSLGGGVVVEAGGR